MHKHTVDRCKKITITHEIRTWVLAWKMAQSVKAQVQVWWPQCYEPTPDCHQIPSPTNTHKCTYTMYVQVGGQKSVESHGTRRYRQVWAAWHRFWELNPSLLESTLNPWSISPAISTLLVWDGSSLSQAGKKTFLYDARLPLTCVAPPSAAA